MVRGKFDSLLFILQLLPSDLIVTSPSLDVQRTVYLQKRIKNVV